MNFDTSRFYRILFAALLGALIISAIAFQVAAASLVSFTLIIVLMAMTLLPTQKISIPHFTQWARRATIAVITLLPLIWFGPHLFDSAWMIDGGDSNYPIHGLALFQRTLGVWDPAQHLGFDNSIYTSFLFPYYALFALAEVLHIAAHWAEITLFCAILFTAAISIDALLRDLFGPQHLPERLLGVLYYCVNPWAMNQWNEQHWNIWMPYAVAPALYLASSKYIESGRRTWLALFVLVIFAIGTAFGNPPIIVTTIIAPLLIFWSVQFGSLKPRLIIKRVLDIVGASIGVSLWWALPFAYGALFAARYQPISKVTRWADWSVTNIPFVETLRGLSFWAFHSSFKNAPYITYAPSYSTRTLFIATLVVPALALSAPFFRMPILIRRLLIWGAVGLLLVKGPNAPFGGAFDWIFTHVPLFWLFRSVYDKFGAIVALSFTILAVFALVRLRLRLPQRAHNVLVLFAFASCLVGSYPMFTGEVIPRPNGNYPGYYVKFPKAYLDLGKRLTSLGMHRILELPELGYAPYDEYSWGYQGGDFIYQVVNQSLVTIPPADSQGSVFAQRVVQPLLPLPQTARSLVIWQNRLYSLGIDGIVVREDSNTGMYAKSSWQSWQAAIAQISKPVFRSRGHYSIYRPVLSSSAELQAYASIEVLNQKQIKQGEEAAEAFPIFAEDGSFWRNPLPIKATLVDASKSIEIGHRTPTLVRESYETPMTIDVQCRSGGLDVYAGRNPEIERFSITRISGDFHDNTILKVSDHSSTCAHGLHASVMVPFLLRYGTDGERLISAVQESYLAPGLRLRLPRLVASDVSLINPGSSLGKPLVISSAGRRVIISAAGDASRGSIISNRSIFSAITTDGELFGNIQYQIKVDATLQTRGTVRIALFDVGRNKAVDDRAFKFSGSRHLEFSLMPDLDGNYLVLIYLKPAISSDVVRLDIKNLSMFQLSAGTSLVSLGPATPDPGISVLWDWPFVKRVDLNVHGSDAILALNQTFSPGWVLLGAPSRHFLANGFENAWVVHSTGPSKITLLFWPAVLFYFGLAASALCGGILAAALLLRKRGPQKPSTLNASA